MSTSPTRCGTRITSRRTPSHVRGGAFENPEGSSRARNAVIEFPTYHAALECWKSPDYQHAITLREPVSTADLVIIEGYEGAQPA